MVLQSSWSILSSRHPGLFLRTYLFSGSLLEPRLFFRPFLLPLAKKQVVEFQATLQRTSQGGPVQFLACDVPLALVSVQKAKGT